MQLQATLDCRYLGLASFGEQWENRLREILILQEKLSHVHSGRLLLVEIN